MNAMKYVVFIFSLWFLAGCEKLEDTYSDYKGDGEVRYLGKCSNVSLSPGWKRLIVKWTNNIDPMIDKVKVKWTLGGESRDTLLNKNATECSIPNLRDGNYEVRVCAVDRNGNTSLSSPFFARPYTATHETIIAFTRLISKHYFVKDRLALFFSDWQSNVEKATLSYTSKGERKSLVLNTELVAKKYYLLDDKIDPGTTVILDRVGKVEGCNDLIVFEPYELSLDKLYSSDMRRIAKEKYGQENIIDEWVNSRKELELDYSIVSFEDILNFPNLEKLILGKNRYLRTDLNDTTIYSKLENLECSLFVLDVANKVCGVKVERYFKHYFKQNLDYVSEINILKEPKLTYLKNSDWMISCSEEDVQPYDSHLEALFDGNLENWWQPEFIRTRARTYEIVLDIREVKHVSGIKVVQKSFNKNDAESLNLMPGVMKIAVSTDKLNWENATFVEENIVGTSNGEATIINFKETMDVRYLKFILYDQIYGQNFSVSLAEIGIFE